MSVIFKHQQYFISDPSDLKYIHESEPDWISPCRHVRELSVSFHQLLGFTCFGRVSRDSVLYVMHLAGRVAMFLFVCECCSCLHACMHACICVPLCLQRCQLTLAAHIYHLLHPLLPFSIFLSSHPKFTPFASNVFLYLCLHSAL